MHQKISLRGKALQVMVECLDKYYPGIKELLEVKEDRLSIGKHMELFVIYDPIQEAAPGLITPGTTAIKPLTKDPKKEIAKTTEEAEKQKEKELARAVETGIGQGAMAIASGSKIDPRAMKISAEKTAEQMAKALKKKPLK